MIGYQELYFDIYKITFNQRESHKIARKYFPVAGAGRGRFLLMGLGEYLGIKEASFRLTNQMLAHFGSEMPMHQIVRMNDGEVMRVKNIGRITLRELKEILASDGLNLSMSHAEVFAEIS